MYKKFKLITYLTTRGILSVVFVVTLILISYLLAFDVIPLLDNGYKEVAYIFLLIIFLIVLTMYFSYSFNGESIKYLYRSIRLKSIKYNGVKFYYKVSGNNIIIYSPFNYQHWFLIENNEVNIDKNSLDIIIVHTINNHYYSISSEIYKQKKIKNKLKINVSNVQN